MKIHILFELKPGASGGGNQFLKALRKYLTGIRCYAEHPGDADAILFNSYQYIPETVAAKKRYPKKIFVHRIDGPIRLYNRKSDRRDLVTNCANHLVADATIFQSSWSQTENYRLGLKRNRFETVIMNAPDPTIFNRDGKAPFAATGKIRLIATSWSPNWNKGFEVYQWLDRNLDFEKYEMAFIGRSPTAFKNISITQPLGSIGLAEHLKNSDIFITASLKDPCSNSLIEALHCGLPALAINEGGHPEIVRQGGLLFNDPGEIPQMLDRISIDYQAFQRCIDMPTIDAVGQVYHGFMASIHEAVEGGSYRPKRFSFIDSCKVSAVIAAWRWAERLSAIKNYL